MRELRSMMLANARADLLGFPSGVAGSESADDRVRRALMNASESCCLAPVRAVTCFQASAGAGKGGGRRRSEYSIRNNPALTRAMTMRGHARPNDELGRPAKLDGQFDGLPTHLVGYLGAGAATRAPDAWLRDVSDPGRTARGPHRQGAAGLAVSRRRPTDGGETDPPGGDCAGR